MKSVRSASPSRPAHRARPAGRVRFVFVAATAETGTRSHRRDHPRKASPRAGAHERRPRRLPQSSDRRRPGALSRGHPGRARHARASDRLGEATMPIPARSAPTGRSRARHRPGQAPWPLRSPSRIPGCRPRWRVPTVSGRDHRRHCQPPGASYHAGGRATDVAHDPAHHGQYRALGTRRHQRRNPDVPVCSTFAMRRRPMWRTGSSTWRPLNQGHALARFAGHGVRWGAEMFGTGS